MPNYSILIKSHCEAPDYEDQCYASSKEEAANIFYKNLPWEGREEWSPKALLRHIYREEDPDYSPEQAIESKI